MDTKSFCVNNRSVSSASQLRSTHSRKANWGTGGGPWNKLPCTGDGANPGPRAFTAGMPMLPETMTRAHGPFHFFHGTVPVGSETNGSQPREIQPPEEQGPEHTMAKSTKGGLMPCVMLCMFSSIFLRYIHLYPPLRPSTLGPFRCFSPTQLYIAFCNTFSHM